MSNPINPTLARYFELVATAPEKFTVRPRTKAVSGSPRDKFCAILEDVVKDPDAYCSTTDAVTNAIWISEVKIKGKSPHWRIIPRYGREELFFTELGWAAGQERGVWPTRQKAVDELHHILAMAREGLLDKTINAMAKAQAERTAERLAAKKAKKDATKANDDTSKQEAA